MRLKFCLVFCLMMIRKKISEPETIRADYDVPRKIYDLRTKARLSQRALAKLSGTTASVIFRLENADHKGR